MRTLLVTALLSLAALAAPPRPVFAQDIELRADDPNELQQNGQQTTKRENGIEYRRRLLEGMGSNQKERLRRALEQFKRLSPEKRDELRRRAKQVGADRLEQLARRDIERLKRKHAAYVRERNEVVALLGGPEQFAQMPRNEQRYIEATAAVRFQTFLKRKLMGVFSNLDLRDLQQMSPEERRERAQARRAHIEGALLEELPEAERVAYRALPEGERRKQRHRLMADYRTRHIPEFATMFEHTVLRPFLTAEPAQRAETVERWEKRARWFHMRRVMEHEIRLPPESLKLLHDLGPEELARVRDLYVDSQNLPLEERRLKLHEQIRRLHGQAALDPRRRRETRREHPWGENHAPGERSEPPAGDDE